MLLDSTLYRAVYHSVRHSLHASALGTRRWACLRGSHQRLDRQSRLCLPVFPRGIERVGAVTQNPHKWTSKYGSVALTAYDNATHQGVNEKGLSVHVLYLAEVCDFGKRDPKREGIGVLQWGAVLPRQLCNSR